MIAEGLQRLSRAAIHIALIGLVVVVMSVMRPRSSPGAFILVNTTDDEMIDDATCSLREAIIAANRNSNLHENACLPGSDTSTDTIRLVDLETYVLIEVGSDEDDAETGDLDIVDNTADVDLILMVENAGAATILQTDLDRVLDIQSDVEMKVIGVTIRGGSNVDDGGGIRSTEGTLTVRDSVIVDNSATNGGGIANLGSTASLTVNGSLVGSNDADLGGGIYNSMGTVTIEGESLVGGIDDPNIASSAGGGIANVGGTAQLTVDSSDVSANSALLGGGIYNNLGSVDIVNLSIIGGLVDDFNAASGFGGGAYNFGGSVTVQESIIVGNQAPSGGGLYSEGDDDNSAKLIIDDSFVAANLADDGAGIYNAVFSTLEVENEALIGSNCAANNGSGIYNAGDADLLTDSTIGGNCATGSGGGVFNSGTMDLNSVGVVSNGAGAGGGIFNASTGILTLTDSVVELNDAATAGGIDNFGTLTLTNSVVAENFADLVGGLSAEANSTTTINGSIIIDNQATVGIAGGLMAGDNATVSIDDTIVYNNLATGDGGAIYAENVFSLSVTNSSLVWNSATNGGAVYSNATSIDAVSVTDSCIYGNSSDAMWNNETAQQNATGNWWGADDGPFPDGSGDSYGGDWDVSGHMTEFPDFPDNGCGQLLLTVEGTGSGNGFMDELDLFVDCDSAAGVESGDCTEYLLPGDEITIYATPDTDSVFISWTNCDDVAGDACFVSMYDDWTVSARFELSVGPIITSDDNVAFEVGVADVFTVMAIGDPTITFNIAETLPDGLLFDGSTGVLSGTPDPGTGGVYPLTITATNGIGPDDIQNFTLTIYEAPTITSVDNATFTVGTAGSFFVTATGEPPACFCLTSGALPSGVYFDDTTGEIYGTPDPGTGGVYPLTIVASNGIDPDDTQDFTLTVEEAPQIISMDNVTFTVGTTDTFPVETIGYPAEMTFSLSGDTLPSSISFDTSTGEFSGTPTSGDGGVYSLIITASNGVSPDATQNFTFTINEAPQITSVDNATFTVGTAGSFFVTTTGTPPPCYCLSGTLPSGVSFDNLTGELYGTPDPGTGGVYPLTITASNGIDPDDTQDFTLTVEEAPTITSPDNVTFTVGTADSLSVETTGYPEEMTFSLSGDTLPSSISFDTSTGVFSGTPTTGDGGVYSLTIIASNGVSPDASQSFTLTINQAPAITSANEFTFVTTRTNNFNVTATGFPAPTYSATGLPSGVSLNATSGLLSGTPTAVGNYTVNITASNGVLPNATQSFTLMVIPPPVWNYTSMLISGCNSGQPYFKTNLSSLVINYQYTASIVARTASGYFMAQSGPMRFSKTAGAMGVLLYNDTSMGLTPVLPFPMPAGSPVQVILTIGTKEGRPLYQTSYNYVCNTGSVSGITSGPVFP